MKYLTRGRYYQFLAIAKKQLQMDDDTYRLFLQNHGATERDGKISATTMAIGDLFGALESLKQRGFVIKNKNNKRTRNNSPLTKKLYAQWCALADAGVVKNRSWKSMTKYCAQHTHVADLAWASNADLNKCIESLKNWMQREGVSVSQQQEQRNER